MWSNVIRINILRLNYFQNSDRWKALQKNVQTNSERQYTEWNEVFADRRQEFGPAQF